MRFAATVLTIGLLATAAAVAAAPPVTGAAAPPDSGAIASPDSGAAAVVAPAPRPRIGLVLSGGGARGGAHLGVLKVLEALNVPVDVIVGTSAGAIIAASYASGLPLADIEREMGELRTATIFRDVNRGDTSLRNKADDAVNYIGPEVGVRDGAIALPKGAVAGVSIEAILRRLTARQRSDDFDRLPIPFRAVATDLTTSEMVVLDHGSLALAARASMAIPAVLDPIELDGRLLVDGGLSRNLPIDVARALGADVIIAVNIGTPLRRRAEINNILSVSDQITRILTNTNVGASLAELRPGDVLITPDLGTLETGDFDRLPEAASAGERAAEAAADLLGRYAIASADYQRWHSALVSEPSTAAGRIDAVRVTGTDRVNPEVIAAAIRSQRGDDFDPHVADEDVKRIYARGDFERVSYTLTNDPAAGRVLSADVVEKSWGPNYLRFGLSLSSDLHGDSFFTLLASHRATWLNALGGEWRNDLQIGHSDRISTEFYQPLTPAQRLFVAPHAESVRDPFDLYVDGVRVASYRRGVVGGGIDLGVPLGAAGEVRLGVSRGRLKLYTDTSIVPGELFPAVEMGGVNARLRVDTLDNRRFPRAGYDADVQVYASRGALGADDTYTKVSASGSAAFAGGPHAVQLQVRGATALGGGILPRYELYSLGGFLQLSGYRTGEFLGRQLAFGRAVYSYRVSAPGLLDGAYVGGSLESGRLADPVVVGQRTTTRVGASLYFAFDTPLGPVYLAYGHGEGSNQAVYLFLGLPP